MAARCETCHFWIPSSAYVEGGTEGQQTGHCKFNPEPVRTQSWHWCGKWQVPSADKPDCREPAHTADTLARFRRDRESESVVLEVDARCFDVRTGGQ